SLGWRNHTQRPWVVSMIGISVICILYGLNFDSSDVYVFYIPVYFATAALAGLGFDWAANKAMEISPWKSKWALPCLCAFLPVFWYATLPTTLSRFQIYVSKDKGNTYYLWPPKTHAFIHWNDQVVALMRVVRSGSPILTDWNYK